MPKFIICEKDVLIIDFDNGKRYVTNPTELLLQSNQKGPTCWFYSTFVHLRARYGQEYQGKENREAERALSLYRKTLTKLDIQYNRIHEISKTASLKAKISIAKKTLIAFGVEARNIHRFIEAVNAQSEGPVEVDTANLDEYATQLHFAVLSKARDIFDIRIIPWTPRSSFNEFMHYIRDYGKIAVGGYMGLPYYKSDSHFLYDEDFYGLRVYAFPPSAYEIPSTGISSHQITIIGARRCKSSGKEFVYYIDPNQTLDPTKPRTVFMMSYRSLCHRVGSIHGDKIFSSSGDLSRHNPFLLRGPFALVAGQDLDAAYLNVEDFVICHWDNPPQYEPSDFLPKDFMIRHWRNPPEYDASQFQAKPITAASTDSTEATEDEDHGVSVIADQSF